MSGTTPGGLPYPTGTDLVRDGDNAIQALAEAIQARGGAQKIQRESVVVTADGNGTFARLFPVAFTGQPSIAVAAGSAGSGVVPLLGIVSIDQNGFVGALLQVTPGGTSIRSGATWIYYIAVGPA
jgi:hypothetical protein